MHKGEQVEVRDQSARSLLLMTLSKSASARDREAKQGVT